MWEVTKNTTIRQPQHQREDEEASVPDSSTKSDPATDRDNQLSDSMEKEGPSDYETAVSACGYGKFNYLLTMGFVPITCLVQTFIVGSTAVVMPAAECDLELTDFQKGTLNAAVSAGGIGAGLVWGALADKFGRQKILTITLLSDFLVGFTSSFVHAYWLLFILKFLDGIILAGPGSVILSYLAETHDSSHRAQTIMWIGMGIGFAEVVLSLLAFLVIPLQIRIPLLPGVLDLTSWRVFLMICSVPSLVGGVSSLLLPETPKFLMSQGRNEEALRVFKNIYVWNTGNAASTYPITALKVAEANEDKGNTDSRSWLGQFRTVFRRPYVTALILVASIQFGTMIWLSYLRLWTPQLFHSIEQYDTLAESYPTSPLWSNASNVCEKLSAVLEMKGPNAPEAGRCQPVSGDVYLRSVVTGAMVTSSFLISRPIVRRVGQKVMVCSCLPLAGLVAMGLNWAPNAEWMMALVGLYRALASNSNNALAAVKVDLFPTQARAFSMSLIMMCMRLGGITGNLTLPMLLAYSCTALFWCIGVCLLACGALAWLLPLSRNKN